MRTSQIHPTTIAIAGLNHLLQIVQMLGRQTLRRLSAMHMSAHRSQHLH